MREDYVLVKGNEAIAEAALRAGCRFYAGYPITPQSEILEYMADHMEERGGVFIQGENEIASMSMLYGAAACGARCMSSSSGPGFDLKQEEISYLSAANLPAVLVNAMRYGLATARSPLARTATGFLPEAAATAIRGCWCWLPPPCRNVPT